MALSVNMHLENDRVVKAQKSSLSSCGRVSVMRSRKAMGSLLLCGTALFCVPFVITGRAVADDISPDESGSPVGSGYVINNSGNLTLDKDTLSSSGITGDSGASIRQTGKGITTLTGDITRNSFGTNNPSSDAVDESAKHMQPDPTVPRGTPRGAITVEQGVLTVDRAGSIETDGFLVIGRGDHRNDDLQSTDPSKDSDGTLNIINGGSVVAQPLVGSSVYSSVIVGYGPGATGTVDITGEGSFLSNDDGTGVGQTVVGDIGGTGTINVGDKQGGSLTTGRLIIGGLAGANESQGIGPAIGTVNVNGNGKVVIGPSSGATTISGLQVGGEGTGTLNIGDGTGNSTVTVNGQLILGNSSGDHNGKATVNLNSGGTLIVGDVGNNAEAISVQASNYTFNFGGGTLKNRDVGGNLSDGADAVLVDNTNTTIDTNKGTVNIYGDLSGGGNISLIGGGLVSLDGANTYSGTTMIGQNTTLYYGETSSEANRESNKGTSSYKTLTRTSAIIDNGSLKINHGDNVKLTQNISGTGDFWKLGSGNIMLNGQNTYTGDTHVLEGSLIFGDGTAKGTNSDGTVAESKRIILQNASVVRVVHSDDVKLVSDVFGQGSFVQSGSGTTILTGSINLDGMKPNQPLHTKNPVATFLVDQGQLVVDGTSGGIKNSDGSYKVSEVGGRVAVSTNGYVVIGRRAGMDARLVIQDGAGVEARSVSDDKDVRSSTVVLGFASGSKGSVTVTGKQSSLVADGAQGLIVVGNNGSGTLTVTHGGYARADKIAVGQGSGSTGNLTVTDKGFLVAGSEVSNGNSGLLVNGSGDGKVTVSNGGYIIVNGQMSFGDNVENSGGSGVFNLDKGGVLQVGDLKYTDSNGVVKHEDGIVAGNQPYHFNFNGGTLRNFTEGRLKTSVDMNLVEGSNSSVDANGGLVTLGGVLSGAGSLGLDDSTDSSAGRLILAGNNTYTGATIVRGGTLQVGDNSDGENGSLGQTSAVHLVNSDSALAMHRGGRMMLSAPIDGAGRFEQDGSGISILTADNSYTGETIVNKGTLQVDGNQSRATGVTTVAYGATLRGTGTVGGDVNTVGGILAPSGIDSNKISTMTINGNLIMSPDSKRGEASVLSLRLGPDHTSDLVNVQKAVLLKDGTKLVVTPQAGVRFGDHYAYHVIAAHQGIAVNLDVLNENIEMGNHYLFATVKPGQISGETLDLILGRRPGLSYAVGAGMTRNGNEVGHVLDSSSSVIAWDAPYMDDSSFDSDGNMSSDALAQRQKAYNALSGEINASLRTALFQDSFYIRQAVLGHIVTEECDGLVTGHESNTAAQPHTYRLASKRCASNLDAVWGQAYGGIGRNSGDGNAAALHHDTAGFIVGVDRSVGERWRVGAVLGYDHTGFSVNADRNSSGHSNDVTVGTYAGGNLGAVRLRTGLSYTWNMVSTNRHVNYNVYTDSTVLGRAYSLNNSYTGGVSQAYGELAYHFRPGENTYLEPFTNAAYVNQYNGGSTETGSPARLHVYSSDTGVTFLSAGLRGSTKFYTGDMVIQPYGSVAYRHAFGNLTPTVKESFAGDSSVMDIAGVPMSDNTALLDFGVRAWFSDMMDVSLSYVGQYGQHARESGARANVRVRF